MTTQVQEQTTQLVFPGFDEWPIGAVDLKLSGTSPLYVYSDEDHNEIAKRLTLGKGVRLAITLKDLDTGEVLHEIDVMANVDGKSFKRSSKKGLVETISVKMHTILAAEEEDDDDPEE